MRHFILGLAALLTLTSCAPTEAMFKDRVHMMKTDPDYLNDATDNCIAHFHETRERLVVLGKHHGVPPQNVAHTFCKRFVGGMVSGQMEYQDLNAVFSKKTVTPKMRKIMDGG